MLLGDEQVPLERFRAVTDSRPDDAPWPQMSWPPAPDVELTGTAVTLSRLDPDRDAAELFAVLDHDVVWRQVPNRPQNPAHFAQILAKRQAQGYVAWLVRLTRPLAGLPAGAAVGTSSYLDVEVHDARLEIGGTTYTPAVWGGGVNPDTKLQLLGHAFEVLGAGRVQLKTDVRNIRSQQAIARLGARYEGTLRRHKRRADGSVRDSVLFALIAEEWPAARHRLEQRLAGPAD